MFHGPPKLNHAFYCCHLKKTTVQLKRITLEFTEFIALKLLQTVTYTEIESNFLPNIENSGTIGGTGAEVPQKVSKQKSWVAAECQIRQ